jgi:hypothetical protein
LVRKNLGSVALPARGSALPRSPLPAPPPRFSFPFLPMIGCPIRHAPSSPSLPTPPDPMPPSSPSHAASPTAHPSPPCFPSKPIPSLDPPPHHPVASSRRRHVVPAICCLPCSCRISIYPIPKPPLLCRRRPSLSAPVGPPATISVSSSLHPRLRFLPLHPCLSSSLHRASGRRR